MKHKIISLATAVCMLLIAAVPGFGASACGDNSKSCRISDTVCSRICTGKPVSIRDKADSSNRGCNILSSKYKQSTGSTDTTAAGSTDTTAAGSSISANAQEVIRLVNKERNAAGLPALTENSRLSEAAQAKAEDMMKNGYFSHTSPEYGSPFEMMRTFGITYTAAGENIAKGQKTPAAVMDGWMSSSGHRANILKASYEQTGVGFCKDSSGVTYWVQMFIR